MAPFCWLSPVIRRQSVEVVDIVEDLLVAARTDIGQVSVLVGEVDLREAVDRVIEEGLTIHDINSEGLQVSGGSVRCAADSVRVRQVLRNLLSNAARYGGQRVQVSLKTDGPFAVVEVSDDGDGIPDSDANLMFEPYRIMHDRPTQPNSIGLGLAVSRSLARLMGGDLTLRRVDGWTVFRLELPIAP